MPVFNFESLPLLTSMEDVNLRAAKEIARITDWMQLNASQITTQLREEEKDKFEGDSINLIAGCPESKPFWVDYNRELTCIACNFSQKQNKTKMYEHFEKISWMTKHVIRMARPR